VHCQLLDGLAALHGLRNLAAEKLKSPGLETIMIILRFNTDTY
jgi:hypothetical protein